MHIFKISKLSNTSSLVIANASNPLRIAVCLTITESNHPHLLFLFVTVPNSFPLSVKVSPIESFSSYVPS